MERERWKVIREYAEQGRTTDVWKSPLFCGADRLHTNRFYVLARPPEENEHLSTMMSYCHYVELCGRMRTNPKAMQDGGKGYPDATDMEVLGFMLQGMKAVETTSQPNELMCLTLLVLFETCYGKLDAKSWIAVNA